MGKIRVKTIGDESLEAEQKKEAKKRAEAKRAEKETAAASDLEEQTSQTPKVVQTSPTESVEEEKKQKRTYKRKAGISPSKYKEALTQVDRAKLYSLTEALELLPKLTSAKFDETVELHVNTTQSGISGNVTLPHGTGKQTRVAIANPQTADELVKTIESGKIEFDILVATPDAMPKLARVAKFLGPRGLMPNPKNGTVTPDPDKVAKQYEGGQINFKTEAKAPLLHLTVGKVSFGEDKLADNIKSMVSAVQSSRITNVTLKSTMSPGIKLNVASL